VCHELNWLAPLLAGVQLSAASLDIRLGPTRLAAYLIVVLLLSTSSLFCLNAFLRM
jgi:hypothetical protein